MERKITVVVLGIILGLLGGFAMWYRPMPFATFLVFQGIGALAVLILFVLGIRYCLKNNLNKYAIALTVIITVLAVLYAISWSAYPDNLTVIYGLTAVGGFAIFATFVGAIGYLIDDGKH